MSDLCIISSNNNNVIYTLESDRDALGGVRVTGQRTEGAGQDTVTISDAGKMLAEQIAALRDEQAKAVSAEERYAAAQSFGISDYAAAVEKNPKLAGLGEDDPGKASQAINVTSKQGTIVTVASIVAGGELPDAERAGGYTAQITRRDGLQINLALNEDIRVNDLEDGGLAVYFAQSGISHMYDASGNKSVLEGQGGELAGTAGDDILINRFGSFVDASDGDDTIINLAHNATILGGKGDDAILVPVLATGLSLDGGAGNDLIVAQGLTGSTVTMLEGDDRLVTGDIRSGDIQSAGHDAIRASGIYGTEIHSETGGLHLAVASLGVIYESNITLGNEDNTITSATSGSIIRSNISMGNGNNTININHIEQGKIQLGNGNNTINANSIHSNYYVLLGNGNNTIHTSRNIVNSRIHVGNGNNTIDAGESIFDTEIRTGNGNNTVAAGLGDIYGTEQHAGIHLSEISFGNGNNTIYGLHVDKSRIKTGNGNNTVRAESLSTSIIHTGAGNDSIKIGSVKGSILNTGGGDDFIKIHNAFASVIAGGAGNDTIKIGVAEYSHISGGGADDILEIGAAHSSIVQGASSSADPWAELQNYLQSIQRDEQPGEPANDKAAVAGSYLRETADRFSTGLYMTTVAPEAGEYMKLLTATRA
ncbi:MAG: hypothetical protein LBC79_01215 [Deltaproteobacteria bacterium]|jgi:hypothetical protein|nr:hypothetical protein [Deltaproteobacteria bacterium]